VVDASYSYIGGRILESMYQGKRRKRIENGEKLGTKMTVEDDKKEEEEEKKIVDVVHEKLTKKYDANGYELQYTAKQERVKAKRDALEEKGVVAKKKKKMGKQQILTSVYGRGVDVMKGKKAVNACLKRMQSREKGKEWRQDRKQHGGG